MFVPGARVRIQGLKARPDLNGRTGSVDDFSGATGRYNVKVEQADGLGHEVLALKPTSLARLADGPLPKDTSLTVADETVGIRVDPNKKAPLPSRPPEPGKRGVLSKHEQKMVAQLQPLVDVHEECIEHNCSPFVPQICHMLATGSHNVCPHAADGLFKFMRDDWQEFDRRLGAFGMTVAQRTSMKHVLEDRCEPKKPPPDRCVATVKCGDPHAPDVQSGGQLTLKLYAARCRPNSRVE